MTKVYVGMSGGVDSSVAAALLKEQGYDVTGVYMKNWAQDLPGFSCPWKEDLADAKRVAVQLGIPFKIYDFQTHYRQKVVEYMIDEYKAGRTPNPDIMCNQEIKFKLFLDTALEDGADMIATGHYAKVRAGKLYMAADTEKDQTYFLYRVTEGALRKTLFPLGGMKKPEVRTEAQRLGLITARKKDSVGICFVGEIGMKDFLGQFVKTQPGNIVDSDSGAAVGEHDGAIFYTIGQRRGLGVGGGLPYYVVGKSMEKNKVYVSRDLARGALWSKGCIITHVHWLHHAPKNTQNLQARFRHRGPLAVVEDIQALSDTTYRVTLKDEAKALAAGQSLVLYQDGAVLGGGIIS